MAVGIIKPRNYRPAPTINEPRFLPFELFKLSVFSNKDYLPAFSRNKPCPWPLGVKGQDIGIIED